MLSSPPRSFAAATRACAREARSPSAAARIAGDIGVGDHRREAVRAEEQDVPRRHPAGLDVDDELGAAAERAGHHVAQRVAPRLLGRDDPALHLLVDPRVVARQQAELPAAPEVDAAVADVRDVGDVAVHEDRGHRRRHALELGALPRRLEHPAVRVPDRGLQPVAVVGDRLVEAERPGDLLVAPGERHELVDRRRPPRARRPRPRRGRPCRPRRRRAAARR